VILSTALFGAQFGPIRSFNIANIIGNAFHEQQNYLGVLGRVEQRLRVGTGKYRVPDLMALPLDYDRSQKIVAIAPLVCIEILSPETQCRLFISGAGIIIIWVSLKPGFLIQIQKKFSSQKTEP